MSNISKMGQLPTPVVDQALSSLPTGMENAWKCSIQKKHLETTNQKHCQMLGLVSEENGGFFPRMRSPSGNQVRKSKSLFWGGKWSAKGLSSIARLGNFCRKKKRERKTSSLQAWCLPAQKLWKGCVVPNVYVAKHVGTYMYIIVHMHIPFKMLFRGGGRFDLSRKVLGERERPAWFYNMFSLAKNQWEFQGPKMEVR